MRRLAGLLASIAASIFGIVHSASYVYIAGPGADNGVAAAHCSGVISGLDAAKAACSEDLECTMLLATDCDDEAWRTCSIAPFVVYSAGSGTDACTMLKAEEVTETHTSTSVSTISSVTSTTSTFTDGLYVDGPRVKSDTWEGRCHGEWSTREIAQAACDADAGCFFVFSFNCQPWAWLPCGDSGDLSEMITSSAAAEAEDAESCTGVLTSLVTASDTGTRTSTTRTATQTTQTPAFRTMQTSTRTATEMIASTDAAAFAAVPQTASRTSTTPQARAPAAAPDRAPLLGIDSHLVHAAVAGLVLGCVAGTCCWVYMGCPGPFGGLRERSAGKKRRGLGLPRLQDPVVFSGEENPWVPPTATVHPSRRVMPQTTEFGPTVEDDPKVADDPLSVLDQEVLDRVLDVAMQLRRI